MKKRMLEKRRILWLLFTLFFLWTAEDVTTIGVEAAGSEPCVILRESEGSSRRNDDEDEDDEDRDRDDDDDDRRSSRRKRARDEEEDEEEEDEKDGKFPWVPVLIAVFSVLAVILIILIIILLTKNGKSSRRADDRRAYRQQPDPYRTEDSYPQAAGYPGQDTYQQPEPYPSQDQYRQPAAYQPQDNYQQAAAPQAQDAYQPQDAFPQPQEPYQQPQDAFPQAQAQDAYQPQDAFPQPQEPYQQPQDTYPQAQGSYQQPQGAYQPQDAFPQPGDPYPQPQPQPQPQPYDMTPVMGRDGDTVVLGGAQRPPIDGEETLTMNIKRGPFVVISDPFNPQRTFRAEIRHHVVVGRKPPAEIIIDYDTGVSGSHCEIVNDGGTFYLKDLNSVNGTMYNGIPVREPVPIQGGGKLRIGRYEYDVNFED